MPVLTQCYLRLRRMTLPLIRLQTSVGDCISRHDAMPLLLLLLLLFPNHYSFISYIKNIIIATNYLSAASKRGPW